MAIKRAPKRRGQTLAGQPPSRSRFTKPVNEESKAGPPILHETRSIRCCGRRPSGPPEDPAGNDFRAFKTALSDICRLVNSLLLGSGAGVLSVREGGCLLCMIEYTASDYCYYYYYYSFIHSFIHSFTYLFIYVYV